MEISGGAEKGVFYHFKSIGDLILQKLTENGDKTAIIDAATSKSLTYTQIKEKSLILARSMQKNHGISTNDTISIVMENCVEFPVVVFATLLLNAKIAPCNSTYSGGEMKHVFDFSKPKLIIASSLVIGKVMKVAKSLDYLKGVVLLGDESSYDDEPFVTLMRDYLVDYDVGNLHLEPVDIRKQVSVILCSSGTTGLPKGVQISQFNLMAALEMVQESLLKALSIPTKGLSALLILPMFHAYAFLTTFSVILTAGCQLVILPKFEDRKFLATIEMYKIGLTFLVPPLMVFLAKSDLVLKYDLSSLKEIVVGTAPLKASTEIAVKKRFNNGLIVRQGFGMSETTLAISFQKTIFKPGSVGELVPGQTLKVVDENGKMLGPNESGELLFKGSQRMMGYIGNEEATKFTIDQDGWLHTGDIGYFDNDKQFFIVDRLKELIKYKAFQVPPAEIEALLLKHPKIKDAAVVGVEDEEAGELALAFVVKQPNQEISENEVKEFVAKQVSKPKHLHGGVRFINDIPKTMSGKILRRELRELLKKSNLKSKL